MNYHFSPKDPNKAYVTNNLLLPKTKVNLGPITTALTFIYGEEEVTDEMGQPVRTKPSEMHLWQETQHHIIVPREFIPRKQYAEFKFEFIDLRPREFPKIDLQDNIVLRDKDQEDAFRALDQSSSGTLNVACGLGKTVLALKLIAKRQVPAVIIVNSTALLEQWKEEIVKFLGLQSVGVIQGLEIQWNRPIVLAMIHTLSKHRTDWPMEFRRRFGLAIYDECFPAGTLIGSKPIEQIKLGDMVPSYDPKLGVLIRKPAVQIFRRIASSLIRLTVGGHSTICTPNHPFITKEGWIPAKDLTSSSMVLGTTHGTAKNHKSDLHRMRKSDFQAGSLRIGADQKEKSFLFNPVPGYPRQPRKITPSFQHQSEVRIGAHETQQPNAKSRVSTKDDFFSESYGVETTCARRKRKTPADSTAASSPIPGMAYGSYGGSKTRKKRVSKKLPHRHSKSRLEDGHRSRRGVSLFLDSKKSGSEKRNLLVWARVDSVEILKPGSDGTFGGLCPDGFVYNLEVEDTHTYLANGFVVHNCHHVSAPLFVRAADLFFGERFGLSATAKRLDGLEPIYQYHLGPVIHRNLNQELIPTTFFHQLKWEFNLRDKRLVSDHNDDFNLPRIRSYLGQLDWRNQIIYRDLTADIMDGRKILVLSHSVDHVNLIAEAIPGAEAITGNTPQDQRMRILKEANPVIGTFQLAREGLNKPSLDTLYVVTPFSSPNDLQQALGRIQRQYSAKKAPIARVYEDMAFGMCRSSCSSLRSHLKKNRYPFQKLLVEVETT